MFFSPFTATPASPTPRVLPSSQHNASVQLLLLLGNFLYIQLQPRCWGGRGGKLSKILGKKKYLMNTLYVCVCFYLGKSFWNIPKYIDVSTTYNLSFYQDIYLSIKIYIYLLTIYLFIYLSIELSIYLYSYLLIYLCIYLSILYLIYVYEDMEDMEEDKELFYGWLNAETLSRKTWRKKSFL